MIQTLQLTPGVVLRHYPDNRFKTALLSIQFQRPMCREEAASNALLSAVLLRGTKHDPDIRALAARQDALYGATVSPLLRRIGDIQTLGVFAGFLEDRFALPGDEILAPVIELVRQILLEPALKDGLFDPEFVESEKRNQIADIESELNDKQSYASSRMIRHLCAGDSFALELRGQVEDVEAITPKSLFDHYQTVLRHSPVEIFYVGSADIHTLAKLLRPLCDAIALEPMELPKQTILTPNAEKARLSERMDVNQCKLSMGFTTPVINTHPDFAAMQVLISLFGTGMTSKLFLNVREKLSLCYYANAGYYASKGVVTVSSGIDEAKYETARAEILRQLALCAQGEISEAELSAAKQALISGLRSIPDSPGALERFYGTASISGMPYSLEQYRQAIQAVTAADAARVASTIEFHSEFFLKGAEK